MGDGLLKGDIPAPSEAIISRQEFPMIIRCIPALFLVFTCLHPAVAQERYKFAFVTHGGPGNPFWNVVIKGMEDAAERYDVDVQCLSNPTFSIEDMPDFLDDAIANKVNGIGITCPDPETIRESVERAHAEGIPVLVLNTADPNAGSDNALPTQFYVGASEYLGGQSNAKAILAEAEKRGIAVQRAVCPIQELGHSGLEARFAGFSSILEERGIAVTVYNRGVVLQVGISLDGEGSNSAKIRVGSLNP